MRLTEKIDLSKGKPCFCEPEHAEEYSTKSKRDAVNKLGKLEDIEEELGVDLITLFKALNDGIWSKGGFYGACYLDNKPDFIPPEKLEIGRCFYMQYDRNDDTYQNYIEEKNALCLYMHDYEVEVDLVRIKDYGKTWALTKEELL